MIDLPRTDTKSKKFHIWGSAGRTIVVVVVVVDVVVVVVVVVGVVDVADDAVVDVGVDFVVFILVEADEVVDVYVGGRLQCIQILTSVVTCVAYYVDHHE